MTEKRFTKQEVYDGINRYKINESNFIVEILDEGIPMHYSTIVNRLNEQDKTITRLEKENKQLKKELVEFKKWEKYVGDVKREELDRVFKMSIYEIAEAFEYYEKRIKELQE